MVTDAEFIAEFLIGNAGTGVGGPIFFGQSRTNAGQLHPEGHTAGFNLSLLTRINAELGRDFDPDRLQYYGAYNADSVPCLGYRRLGA